MERFTIDEISMLRAALDHYRFDIRQACFEDQGTSDGKPGTVGRNCQIKLNSLLLHPNLRAY